MRLQAFVVVLLVAAAAGFVVLNPDVLSETREVQLPGTQVSAPILGIIILAAAGALLLMLVLGAVAELAHDRAQRRMHARLAQREQELAFVKSAAYDRVAGTIEALYREVPALLETEGRRRHEELQARMVALERAVDRRLRPDDDRSVVSTVHEPGRTAA